MAITFDPSRKVISLDSLTVSVSEIWSRWVDWVAQGDNSKYLPALSQLGGFAPVALYIFLENGWRVKPVEANGQTTVEGNLLVQGGGNPFIPTDGNYSSQVFLETPVSAQAIEVNSGSGLTSAQDTRLTELHQLQGLDSANPMTVTPTGRTVGAITQTISGDGTTTSTVTRE